MGEENDKERKELRCLIEKEKVKSNETPQKNRSYGKMKEEAKERTDLLKIE